MIDYAFQEPFATRECSVGCNALKPLERRVPLSLVQSSVFDHVAEALDSLVVGRPVDGERYAVFAAKRKRKFDGILPAWLRAVYYLRDQSKRSNCSGTHALHAEQFLVVGGLKFVGSPHGVPVDVSWHVKD